MKLCRARLPIPTPHDIEVQAESLYEAVALVVAQFLADKLTTEGGQMIVIAIHWPAVNIGCGLTRPYTGHKAHATAQQALSDGSVLGAFSISSPDRRNPLLKPLHW